MIQKVDKNRLSVDIYKVSILKLFIILNGFIVIVISETVSS